MNEQLTLSVELPQDLSIPPKKIVRNDYGLIRGVNYIYTEEGLIDWRKMIRPEFLVVNKQVFERKGKPIPESVEGLKDNEVLILLAGIKELAQLRGFEYITYDIVSPSPDYVVAGCRINWISNYETEGREVTFTAIGDASLKNTSGFGSLYLGPIAENRAFVRAVRNFLKINILGQDEISSNVVEEPRKENGPAETLLKAMAEHSITFEKIKETLIKDNYPDVDKVNSVEDIKKSKIFDLLGRIKKSKEEKV